MLKSLSFEAGYMNPVMLVGRLIHNERTSDQHVYGVSLPYKLRKECLVECGDPTSVVGRILRQSEEQTH